MKRIERRELAIEVRGEGDNGGLPSEIVAMPIVFDQETVVGGQFREVIRPGALSKTLSEGDHVALWNHDTGKPLGRVSAKTLELREEGKGVRAAIRPSAETTYGKDALVSVGRGDVKGGSFGFQVIKEHVVRGTDGALDLREILELRLFEVSLVTFPAYETTTAEARAIKDEWRDQEEAIDGDGATTQEPDQVSTPEPETGADDGEFERNSNMAMKARRLALASAAI